MVQIRSTFHHSDRRGWRKYMLGGLFLLVPVSVLLLLSFQVMRWMFGVAGTLSERSGSLGLPGTILFLLGAICVFAVLCLLVGYLAERTALNRMQRRLDRGLMHVLPGYDRFRLVLAHRLGETRMEPMLMRAGASIKPVFLIEEDDLDRCVVFLPGAPGFDHGEIEVVSRHELIPMPIGAQQMEDILRGYGEGLLAVLPEHVTIADPQSDRRQGMGM